MKRQLSGIPGIVEINSFGGYLKQYEVAVDPDALYSLNITIGEVFEALNRNNQNTGGSYIEKVNRAYYIRSEGMISSLEDIERVVVTNRNGIPVHVSDVAKVKRFGAMTIDGKGECVGGIAMMLKGANANVVTTELEKRVEQVQKMLPEGIRIEPYLNRSELVDRNISTVIRNLIEGAIIVFLVLIIFLGNVDSAPAVLCLQVGHLYSGGIQHSASLTDWRHPGLVAARTTVQHLGRCRLHRPFRCGGPQRYSDD